jgi:hypothetical protein
MKEGPSRTPVPLGMNFLSISIGRMVEQDTAESPGFFTLSPLYEKWQY